MLGRVWEVLKATLAVAALIAAALVSADKLDRQRAQAPVGVIAGDPIVTGAITAATRP